MSWTAENVPFSEVFGDVYYSAEDGLAESRHVFLHGNHLPELWLDRARPGPDPFTIIETGFGTGLNFLAVWQLWRQTAPAQSRLHFISAEAFPLARADMARALGQWDELAGLRDQLTAAYPSAIPGFHRRHFDDGRVALTLLFGDAAQSFAQLEAQADCWFLDGFAPSRNPQMWSEALWAEMARLSAPGARVATFTVAGRVRRGLAGAGFEVAKVPGFGRKREMLSGVFGGGATDRGAAAADGPLGLPPPVKPRRVAVIGGGIAGASMARALRLRGAAVHLFDRHGRLAAEASGNRQGLVRPRLSATATAARDFHCAAFSFARALYEGLDEELGAAWQPMPIFDLALSGEEEARQARLAAAGALPAAELAVTEAAGHRALSFRAAGLLDPAAACASLAEGAVLHLGSAVSGIERTATGWRVTTEEGGALDTEAVVLCAGQAVRHVPGLDWLPLRPRRGQVSYVRAEEDVPLEGALTYGGYVLPAREGVHLVGATFDPVADDGAPDLAVTEAGHEHNLGELRRAVPGRFETARAVGGRTSLRSTTPDHLPIAGPVPDAAAYAAVFAGLRTGQRTESVPPYLPGLYVLGGLGARGLTTAPLAAELIAALLYGEPVPVPRAVADAVAPARFLMRALKRNEI